MVSILKIFLSLSMNIFFKQCYCTFNRLHYGVNTTLYTLGNQKFHLTLFILILASLLWSGTKPKVSLRNVCIEFNFSHNWWGSAKTTVAYL